jgi:predicted MFS family arabinose efflux permease
MSTPTSPITDRLPYSALLALAMAAFITILTEALPAGLLPAMAKDLNVSEAIVGQLVTIYAAGSLISAIPLVMATQRWRRKPLLLLAVGGFAVVNTVTAFSTSIVLTLIARFIAGMFAGLLWALIVGYAIRMVSATQKGRAIAVAMIGTPLALSLGIPAGTLMGNIIGWQYAFGVMSVLTLLLLVWIVKQVPDFPGQEETQGISLRSTLAIPGVTTILSVLLLFVLAHNILYTYIVPFLVPSGLNLHIDAVLLVFGLTSLLGIWIVGVLIDRYLRTLMILCTVLFVVAAVLLIMYPDWPAMVVVAIAAWGIAFGGVPTLFQTALAKTAGEAADVAQSMLVTTWNSAIAGGGIAGGVLLSQAGTSSFPWALLVCLIPAWLLIIMKKQHGFTAHTTTRNHPNSTELDSSSPVCGNQ